MAVRATAIPSDVLDILRASNVAGTTLVLPPGQLERSLYERVNKVLIGLGGKWDRRAKGHVFKTDPRPLFGEAVETGKFTDRKKALQFFETPAAIAQRMVELAEIKKTDLVLEPSAGHGALIAALPQNHPGSYVTAIEIDQANCSVLRKRFPTIDVLQVDFTSAAKQLGTGRYDVALMNPPFTGGQDSEHIRAAWNVLKRGGRLVALACEGTFHRHDGKARWLQDWLANTPGAQSEVLPPGTFRESGTEVATRMIWATKGAEP